MKKIILLLITISTLFAQKPIIKIEGQELLKVLAYTQNSSYVKLYDWNIGSNTTSPIIWDPNGNNWTPKGFERKGKVYLSNHGKVTHTIVDNDTKPGYWLLFMLGNKDKITQVTLTPNIVTLENPSIIIDKAFIQEEIVCEENATFKDTAYRIKFPNKIPFWMEGKTTISSTTGNKNEYIISYNTKPLCGQKSSNKKTTISAKISKSTKEQIRLFLESFAKSGEQSFPAKTLQYYDSKITRYFNMTNVTKEDILEDKIRYYKKYPTRHYKLKDIEVIDSHVTNGIRYYIVNTVMDWNVTSTKGKSLHDISYNIITLIESDNGFLIKAIKTIGENSSKKQRKHTLNSKIDSFKGNLNTHKQNDEKFKTVYFNDSGIEIELTYPTGIQKGHSFSLRAKMTNNYSTAKQGGLTLSFPDITDMHGRIVRNSFNSLKGYSSPDKIYNKNIRGTMRAKYYMIEGWQNKKWHYGESKFFKISLVAPVNLDKLRVNIRGVLWRKGKHDIKEVPFKSSTYDQQGFAVKQLFIPIH